MEAECQPEINFSRARKAFRVVGVELLIAFTGPAEQYCLFPCRSLWTFATFAIFSRSLKPEVLAGRLTALEFRNRAFRNKCGIWKRVFGWLCFSAAGSGFRLPRSVWFSR